MTEEENKREMEYWLGKIILTTLREKRIITDEGISSRQDCTDSQNTSDYRSIGGGLL